MRRLLPLLASLLVLAVPSAAEAFTFYDWDVGAASPTSVAIAGSTAYYTMSNSPDIGRVTLGGVQPASLAGVAGATPAELTAAPGGSTLWFADPALNAVGRVDLAAATPVVSEPVTTGAATVPVDVAAGGDGNIWAVENGTGKIICFDPASPTASPTAIDLGVAAPTAVATARDGSLWVADRVDKKVQHVKPVGTQCAQPTLDAAVDMPMAVFDLAPVP